MASADRIDVHQHVVPPFWAEQLSAHGGDPSGWHSPAWSPDAAKAFMDGQQIAVGVLSLTAPSVQGWTGAERRDMARRVNEYTADLVVTGGGRFGNFASLPLPDVEGAIAEVDHAFDSLGADGIVVLSSYDGAYLGDSRFVPLWDALDRRGATVFIHPGKPQIPVLKGVLGPLIDYPFDTTRTAFHMVVNGVLDRCAKMKVILSHAGGFLPYVSHRCAELSAALDPDGPDAEALIETMRRFYFDTALSSSGIALPSLMSFAREGQVLYGSDFPYAPAAVGASFTSKLDAYPHLTSDQRDAINRGGAKALFARLGWPAAHLR